jgi:hypothetical protein
LLIINKMLPQELKAVLSYYWIVNRNCLEIGMQMKPYPFMKSIGRSNGNPLN